jgi:GTPase SAR1 family protein
VHDKFEDDLEVNRSAKRTRSTNSTLGADYYVKKLDNGRVLLHLWDTAGKERLKPQKIPNEYDKKSNYYQFLSISIKSNPHNTTNYEHRYNNWSALVNGKEKIQTQIQNIQNTSHRRPLHPQHKNRNKPRSDALFRNCDACMLVYDATSSTSFLHLMQWHSEWIQKLKQWDKEEQEKERDRENSTQKKRKRVPFIVVANKIDLLREGNNLSPPMHHPNYRSVMGFHDGEYKGKGYAYEYAVEDYITDRENPQPQYRSLAGREQKQLTYSLKETTWSNDPTYLKSLQLTEDQLPTNRLLILLWCKRNSIPHVEASALSGEGVDEAMNMLVKISVDEFEAREKEKTEQERHEKMLEKQRRNRFAGVDNNIMDSIRENNSYANGEYFVYQPRYDRDLDLFARYSSDDEKKWKCSVLPCFWSFFWSCIKR